MCDRTKMPWVRYSLYPDLYCFAIVKTEGALVPLDLVAPEEEYGPPERRLHGIYRLHADRFYSALIHFSKERGEWVMFNLAAIPVDLVDEDITSHAGGLSHFGVDTLRKFFDITPDTLSDARLAKTEPDELRRLANG